VLLCCPIAIEGSAFGIIIGHSTGSSSSSLKKSFYENPPSLAVLLSSLLWHFPYFTPPSPFLSRSLCGYYIYGVITANRLTFRGKGQCLPLLPHHINYPHFNLIHSFFKKFVLSRDLFLTTTLPYLLHINIKSFLKSCPII
jgi:hypothetical protein